jgi:hypothetical protein
VHMQGLRLQGAAAFIASLLTMPLHQLGWKHPGKPVMMIVLSTGKCADTCVPSYLCPVKWCVTKPPARSVTLSDLSLLPVARKPPDASTAMSATGAR